MKLKTAALAVLILSLVIPHCALAEGYSKKIFPREDFESYHEVVGGSWICAGNSTSLRTVQTEKGKSAELVATPSSYQEMYMNFMALDSEVKTIVTGVSMYLCDLSGIRGYNLRNDSGGFYVFEIQKNGALYVGDINTGVTISSGKWYDFIVEYCITSGFTRIKIFDGEETQIIQTTHSVYGKNGIWRINFVSQKPSSADAVTYIDNCWSYALNYDIRAYAAPAETVDFETFVPSQDGQSVPDGWRVQNTASGATSLLTEGFDGYGKTLKMSSVGSKHFEVFYTFAGIKNDTVTAELDLRRDENSYLSLGLRGTNAAGATSSNSFFLKILSDGTIDTSGTVSGTILQGEWYHAVLNIDMSDQSYTAKFTAQSGTVTAQGSLPKEIAILSEFEFYMPSGNGNSTVYLDNIKVYAPQETSISSFLPLHAKISAYTNEFTVSVSDSFSEEALQNCTVLINGSQSLVAGKVKNGNDITVSLSQPLLRSTVYAIEVINLVTDDGTVINAPVFYYTPPEWEISEINFDGSFAANETVKVSTTVAADIAEQETVSLILALYDKASGEMIGLTYAEADVYPADKVPIECSITLPDRQCDFRLTAYIWDSLDDMQILGTSDTI